MSGYERCLKSLVLHIEPSFFQQLFFMSIYINLKNKFLDLLSKLDERPLNKFDFEICKVKFPPWYAHFQCLNVLKLLRWQHKLWNCNRKFSNSVLTLRDIRQNKIVTFSLSGPTLLYCQLGPNLGRPSATQAVTTLSASERRRFVLSRYYVKSRRRRSLPPPCGFA